MKTSTRHDLDHSFADSPDSGRIIYLGDVRRRKASRHHALPDRHYLVALAVVAGIGWVVWLTVLFTVPPSKLLTYLAFLAPLSLGLATTAALIGYEMEARMLLIPSVSRSIRRGSMFSLIAVGNIAVLGAHRWSVIAFGATVVAALLVDVVYEHRAPYSRRVGRPPRN